MRQALVGKPIEIFKQVRFFEMLFSISFSTKRRYWFFVSEVELKSFSTPFLCFLNKSFLIYVFQLLRLMQLRAITSLYAGYHNLVVADKILIKNNIVALYPEVSKIIKSSILNGSRPLDAFRKEFYMLKALEENGFSFAPKALGLTEKHSGALCAEYIEGEGLGRKIDIPIREILIPFINMYESFGLEMQSIKDHLLIAKILNSNGEYLVEYCSWDAELARFFLNSLRRVAEKKILVSVIHGDAQFGNILLFGDRIKIIDWELSRLDWVCIDISSLEGDCPGIGILYNSWRSQYCNDDFLSVDAEILLVKIMNAVNIDEFKKYYFGRYKSHGKATSKIQRALIAMNNNIHHFERLVLADSMRNL